MTEWRLVYTRQAAKDAKRIARSGLRNKVEALLDLLIEDPFRTPPPFEKLRGDLAKLRGDLAGACSRRINIQHRLVYQVLPEQKIVKIIRMWTHYD